MIAHVQFATLLGSDNLVNRMLMLVCLVVGAISGLVGMFLGSLSGWADPVLGEDPHAPMFLISCVIGFSLAYILMGVVISGVDSVIVCFAEAPGTFLCSNAKGNYGNGAMAHWIRTSLIVLFLRRN